MTVTIRLFATAKDAFGFDTRECSLDEPTIEGVRQLLLRERPASEPVLRSCRFAVNMEYAPANAQVKDGDEIAVIPPVSGG